MGKKRRNNQGASTMTEQTQDQDQEQQVGEQLLQEGAEGESTETIVDSKPAEETGAEGTDVMDQEATPPDPEDHSGEEEEARFSEEACDAAKSAVDALVDHEAAVDLNPGVKDESVQPAEVAVVTEAVQKEPEPSVAQAVDKQEMSENLAYLESVRENGLPIQKQALAAIELFCARMVPRAPITAQQAYEAQRDLLDFITVILRKEYEEFRKGWATLLVYFAEYHGDRPTAKDYSALSEYSTSRHLDTWTDVERGEAYNNLVTLLRITRNVETRRNDVKRIRLDALAPSLLNERSKDNLQRFYN